MSRENGIFLAVLAVLAIGVAGYKLFSGRPLCQGYYEVKWEGNKVGVECQALEARRLAIEERPDLTDAQKAALLAQATQQVEFSWARTLGIWLAAFFTLAMLSFLFKDNPAYKIAEHAFVGISAAYWMTVAFWTTVVPNLLGKLFPRWTKFTELQPGLNLDEIVNELAARSWAQSGESPIGFIDYEAAAGDGLTASAMQLMDIWYWAPMILGVMLLWRLAPSGAWIARWPLAFILGTTAGIRLTGFLESDFLKQIQNSVLPLVQFEYKDGAFNFGRTFYSSMNNILIVGGVMCGLVYFFFSLEHRGLVGRVSRVGIWVLMITFGAGFGYTVMGRIALLVGRFEFLVYDWLNLISRTG